MVHDERALVTLPRAECLALLATTTIGRVVFNERALPAVMPVSYGLVGEDVVLCTVAGSRLERAARDGVLAFEVDEIDPVHRTGWSVVVTGLPVILDEPEPLARAKSALDPWLAQRCQVVITLPATIVTGRRITAEPAVGVG